MAAASPPTQLEDVLALPDLAGEVLAAMQRWNEEQSHSGSEKDTRHATQAAHALCLSSRACGAAVLGAVQEVHAPEAWSCEQLRCLGAMTALVSLRLTFEEGVDPARLPKLPHLTRLQCSLPAGAASAAGDWPSLQNLRELDVRVPGGGSLPPAVERLPHLTRLDALAGAHADLGPIHRLTRLRALALTLALADDAARGLDLTPLTNLTSLAVYDGNVGFLQGCLGQLSALASLNLGYCRSLQELPESLGQLSALTSLDLYYCDGLEHLPDSLGQLSALINLDLCDCSGLYGLPDSLGQLSALASLNLCGCSSLQHLPDSLGQLTALSRLHMRGCRDLQGLPNGLGQLTTLASLSLPECSSLLVDSLCQLAALTSLCLDECSSLECLHDTLCQLSTLISLDLSSCSRLQHLPVFPSKLTQPGPESVRQPAAAARQPGAAVSACQLGPKTVQ
jgi:Leucine-rich repeat (LRR) protein